MTFLPNSLLPKMNGHIEVAGKLGRWPSRRAGVGHAERREGGDDVRAEVLVLAAGAAL